MVAKLIVATGKSAGRAITLKRGQILIGRAEECDVRPLGDEVSRRHCQVVQEGDSLWVEDLKSRNGTFVNGAKIAAKTGVTDGDMIRVGPLELRVAGVAPEPPAKPATPAAADDVSRWLMADDEPAGMFDTTRTVIAADVEASASGVAAAPPPADDSSFARATAAKATADDSASTAASNSEIQALIAAKKQPGALPADARGPRTANSKDAAAEALRKFFGKR